MTLATLVRAAHVPRDRQVLDLFRPSVPAEVGISRSGTDYTILSAIGGNRYLAVVLKSRTFGAYTLRMIDTTYVKVPSLSVLFDDPSIVRTGSGWATSTVASTFTAGDYLEWVAPANTTRIVMGTQILATGGIAAVTIDGDGTVADVLVTAQSLVDAGSLVAWALTTSAKSASDVAINTVSPLAFSGTFSPALDASDVGRTVTIPAALIGYGADVVADHTAGVESGAGWTASSSASFFGGTARFAALAGNSYSWTSPVAARVGVLARTIASGGYARVLVDGATANANLLPTAQDEVTAGRLASSALAANGGTLNPTDRLLDTYSAVDTFQVTRYVADNLASSATHTVTVEVTGYKRTVATLARFYMDAFVSAPTGTPTSLSTTIATVTGPTGGTVASPATNSTTGQTVNLAAGTLAPNQRVFDTYNAGSTLIDVLLAELAAVPSTRTLRVTNTGYFNVASTGAKRLTHGAISYSTPDITPTTPGAVMATIANVYNSASGQNAEYAIRVWPPGAVDTDFKGNNHGYDEEISFAFELDGSPVTPADGSTTWGKRLVITRTSKLHHPDLVPYLADVVTTYTAAGLGLVVENVITWATAGLTASTSYLSMFSLSRYFTKCTTLGHGSVAVLTANDDSVRASRKSNVVVAWMDPGNYAAAMMLDSLDGVEQWRLNPDPALWVQDRSNIDINKMYAGRCTGVESMGVGTVWRSQARYLVQHFTDPDAIFSALPAFA